MNSSDCVNSAFKKLGLKFFNKYYYDERIEDQNREKTRASAFIDFNQPMALEPSRLPI